MTLKKHEWLARGEVVVQYLYLYQELEEYGRLTKGDGDICYSQECTGKAKFSCYSNATTTDGLLGGNVTDCDDNGNYDGKTGCC